MAGYSTVFRRKVFIDRRFQTRFILSYCLLVAVGTILFGATAYFILDRQIGNSLFSAHLAIQRTGDLLLPTMLALSGVFVVILGAASLVITLLISHRISGPLYAMVRYLQGMREGHLDFEAKLRTNDQTAALAEALTDTVHSLAGRLDAMRADVARLDAGIEAFAAAATDASTPRETLVGQADEARTVIHALEEHLAFFKTT